MKSLLVITGTNSLSGGTSYRVMRSAWQCLHVLFSSCSDEMKRGGAVKFTAHGATSRNSNMARYVTGESDNGINDQRWQLVTGGLKNA